MKHWIILGALCLGLSGCGNANWHSINRSFSPGTGDSRLIDAKQRAIISIVDGENGYKGTCAEPSPDALQATAAALSGNGSLSKDDYTAALALAMSSTESAASIGLRTQTIQLLRDAYYRICEGHLSGALDQVSYDILQRRFQNHMIALLAVEQLTGVVKAEQVALTSQSAADAGAQLGVLTAELRRQREELNELKKRKQALDDEVTKLKADIEKQSGDEKAKSEGLLKEKESDQKTLEALIADQEKTVATLQSAVDEASRKTITAQSSTSAKAIGEVSGAARSQALNAEVAKAVTDITLAAINSDYTAQVCTEAFRPRGGGAPLYSQKNTKKVAVVAQQRNVVEGGTPQPVPAPVVETKPLSEGEVTPSTQGTAAPTIATATPAIGQAAPPEEDDVFRKFCKDALDQFVTARAKLTDATIQIEKENATACKFMMTLAATMVDKLKKDITVEEATVVIAAIKSMRNGCGSSQPIPVMPRYELKGIGETSPVDLKELF